ncbi:MAG TPA: FtsQ-type POTRA domain-containing protein [Clostridia bacterium]|nr:FtsQ-type POTRA domain-containing protein [Clostridia bacterium]
MKKVLVAIIIIVVLVLFLRLDVFTINDVSYNIGLYGDQETIENMVVGEMNYVIHSRSYIKDKILEIPMIDSVIVEKKFPNKVKLNIIYKEPFLKITDNNIKVIIDAEGNVLAINKDIKTSFSVKGLELSYYKVNNKLEIHNNKEILSNLIILIKLINKSGIDINNKIDYNNNNVYIYTYTGLKVNFGDCSNIEEKFNNFVNIYHDLQEKKINYGEIDVSITDLPLFRK